eukprot:5997371-Pleurochrysis_carterae.AAC.1
MHRIRACVCAPSPFSPVPPRAGITTVVRPPASVVRVFSPSLPAFTCKTSGGVAPTPVSFACYAAHMHGMRTCARTPSPFSFVPPRAGITTVRAWNLDLLASRDQVVSLPYVSEPSRISTNLQVVRVLPPLFPYLSLPSRAGDQVVWRSRPLPCILRYARARNA